MIIQASGEHLKCGWLAGKFVVQGVGQLHGVMIVLLIFKSYRKQVLKINGSSGLLPYLTPVSGNLA